MSAATNGRVRATAGSRVRLVGRLFAAWVATLAFVLPIYLAVSSAFRTTQQTTANPLGLPIPFTFDNIIGAFQRSDNLVTLGLLNSILVTGCTLVIVIPLSSALSFWIYGRGPRLKTFLLGVFALGLMIPPQITLIPLVQMLQFFGLQNTYPGLILSDVGGGYLAFAVFVYVGFLRGVPTEILEAARVDGASELRIWATIVFPLVRPATATVGIFIGLWTWNDFLNPLIILGPLQGQTITTGIYISLGQIATNYGQLFGVMFIAAIVPVVGYLLTQRQFISGLLAGSSK
ncbi:MAG: raffinose/stachyose/melibiose transport system permease protein [Actinomycetota bacterium]|nr:raffinose/stachyose/melibiose transport system permease protein [Actinomycetota bacterium]